MASALVEALVRIAIDDLEFFQSLVPHVNRALLEGIVQLKDGQAEIRVRLDDAQEEAKSSRIKLESMESQLTSISDRISRTDNRDISSVSRFSHNLKKLRAEQFCADHSNDDPLVEQLRSEAAQLYSDGDFKEASAHLLRAEKIDRSAADDAEQTHQQRCNSAAKTCIQRAQWNTNDGDHLGAADQYREAYDLIASSNKEQAFFCVFNEAVSLQLHGINFGHSSSLQRSIRLLKGVAQHRAPAGREIGVSREIALSTLELGKLSGDATLIKQAVRRLQAIERDLR